MDVDFIFHSFKAEAVGTALIVFLWYLFGEALPKERENKISSLLLNFSEKSVSAIGRQADKIDFFFFRRRFISPMGLLKYFAINFILISAVVFLVIILKRHINLYSKTLKIYSEDSIELLGYVLFASLLTYLSLFVEIKIFKRLFEKTSVPIVVVFLIV
ncbi:MAG TPA: hypothetical protein VNW06_13200, partial [Cytophagaceae bacterium]|nr:hypothetical protein [Cytophagaceae bacterium]